MPLIEINDLDRFGVIKDVVPVYDAAGGLQPWPECPHSGWGN